MHHPNFDFNEINEVITIENNEYKTIDGFAEDEFVEKKSRFIGHLAHIETEEEAIAFINSKKEKYWDASHNVYAYIVKNGGTKRYSDDGEPQGTAGVPVLDVLQKENLTNICVVVTRYFGGILLGGGGLVRAYSHGAKISIDASKIKIMSPCTELSLAIDYTLYGKITYILPKYFIKTLNSDFGADVKLQLLIKDKYLDRFRKDLTEITSGTVEFNEDKKYFYNIEE